jgi:4-amino-4-deoxy-L-arabinose transferase-like glycosyltransferase
MISEKNLPHSGVLLFGLLAAALALRMTGIGFGLPFLYHADEPVVVNHALAYGAGSFHPHFFRIPPLVSYLLFGVYGLIFLAGKAAGIFADVGAFEHLFFTDPSIFYLTGRIVFGALLGTATIFFYYRLSEKISGAFAAAACALLLAVNPLHVRDSHYIYADIPLLFVLVLFFSALFSQQEKFGRLAAHWKIGFWIGLASAVKYNGCFLLVPYAYAWWKWAPPNRRAAALAGCAAAAGLTFAALNPFGFIDFRFFSSRNAFAGKCPRGNGVDPPPYLFFVGRNGVAAASLCVCRPARQFFSRRRPAQNPGGIFRFLLCRTCLRGAGLRPLCAFFVAMADYFCGGFYY